MKPFRIPIGRSRKWKRQSKRCISNTRFIMVNAMNQQLRVACYGFVEKGVGSGSGASFMALEELLRRGYQIDFYGWKGFTEPKALFEYENFHYFLIPERFFLRHFIKLLPDAARKAIYPVLSLLFSYYVDCRSLRQEILIQHQKQSYDVLLFLGLLSPFKIKDLPAVSWVQGPLQTEGLLIQKLRQTIISLCGLSLYIKLTIFYRHKLTQAKSDVGNSDILICGSKWSKNHITDFGVDSKKVWSLSYPIDITVFYPKPSPKGKAESRVLLWLGRLDPRKRFDLLLAAYKLLLQERQDVQLKVFGSLNYAGGYKQLIDNFEFPDHLEYHSSIDRANVPELMAASDVLVQPSEAENFGFSVAEALACGLPVVVGTTNGTGEYAGEAAFVFDQYTPESLKQAILEAIEAIDHDQEQVATNARTAAEQNFDVVKIVDTLETILQQAATISVLVD